MTIVRLTFLSPLIPFQACTKVIYKRLIVLVFPDDLFLTLYCYHPYPQVVHRKILVTLDEID